MSLLLRIPGDFSYILDVANVCTGLVSLISLFRILNFLSDGTTTGTPNDKLFVCCLKQQKPSLFLLALIGLLGAFYTYVVQESDI